MSTWIDFPGTSADPHDALMRDLEADLRAPEVGPCPDCGEPVPLPDGWTAGYGPVCTPCSLAEALEIWQGAEVS